MRKTDLKYALKDGVEQSLGLSNSAIADFNVSDVAGIVASSSTGRAASEGLRLLHSVSVHFSIVTTMGRTGEPNADAFGLKVNIDGCHAIRAVLSCA